MERILTNLTYQNSCVIKNIDEFFRDNNDLLRGNHFIAKVLRDYYHPYYLGSLEYMSKTDVQEAICGIYSIYFIVYPKSSNFRFVHDKIIVPN